MHLPLRSRFGPHRLCLAAALSLGACAGGETGGGSEGSATFGPPTTAAPTNATASATATDSASPPQDDEGDAEDGSGAASDATEDAASGGPPSEQPADGMYSDCLSAVECIGLTTCMTLLDGGGEVSDGFCTVGACMNAAASCDPTPGGTAVPFCFPIEQNGTADDICALDCSGGGTCPAGMECYELSAGSICA